MDKLLTLRQSSEIMNTSYSKAQKLAKSGELPFKKLGSTWVIPQSALFRALGLESSDDTEKHEGGT